MRCGVRCPASDDLACPLLTLETGKLYHYFKKVITTHSVPPLLTGLLYFISIAVLSTVFGERVLRLLKLQQLIGWDRILWSATVGMGVLSFLAFFLFALNCGTPE